MHCVDRDSNRNLPEYKSGGLEKSKKYIEMTDGAQQLNESC